MKDAEIKTHPHTGLVEPKEVFITLVQLPEAVKNPEIHGTRVQKFHGMTVDDPGRLESILDKFLFGLFLPDQF